MERTYSTQPLERVAYYPQGDGTAVALLRDNVAEEVTEDGTVWAADEVQVGTTLSLAEVEERFDELWVRGVTESRPLEERVGELEALLDAAIEVILGGE